MKSVRWQSTSRAVERWATTYLYKLIRQITMFTLPIDRRRFRQRLSSVPAVFCLRQPGLTLLCLGIAACGGGSSADTSGVSGSSPVNPAPPPAGSGPSPDIGVFLDSPVINIGYRTETLEGVTNSLGEYEYMPGQIVTFFIGDLEFPSIAASRTVTVLDLVGTTEPSDPRVVNMIRLLQTLDQDGDPQNGITITEAAKSSATQVDFDLSEVDFSSSLAVMTLIMNAGQNDIVVALVNREGAIDHFSQTLDKLPAGLAFDGMDDRVTVPYDISFPTEIFSAGAWINIVAPPARSPGAIIARGEDDDSWDLVWQLYVTPEGNLTAMVEDLTMANFCYPHACFTTDPISTCTVADQTVTDGIWHHVLVTRNAQATITFFVDGERRSVCENTGVPSIDNFQDLTIGATHGTVGPPPNGIEPPTWFFPGLIDDGAVWNVALSDAEVLAVYTDGVDVSAASLVGFWRFDEGSGQAASDASSYSNHGFLGSSSTADSADPTWN